MKRKLTVMWLIFGALLPAVWGTSVGTGAVRQPMNLGPLSDPGRIPIGWVPCESNYGYGTLGLIAEPFVLTHGGWRWEGGIEMNGNLPSAFGISLEQEDPTTANSPVVIRVRKQTPPGYSPYSKERVLLATMRCLLDSVGATALEPLKITVEVEDPQDESLKRFSGDYVTKRMGEIEFTPTPLPGCKVEVTAGGVEMIVFEGAAEEKAVEGSEPLWMPFPLEGDFDPGYLLLPLWRGNVDEGDPLAVFGRSWSVVQDRFNPASGNPDANLLTRRQRLGHFRVDRTEERVQISFGVNGPQTEELRKDLALLCWAAVLSERPGNEVPLEIVVRLDEPLEEAFQKWMTEGWQETKGSNDMTLLTARFVWDPKTNGLVRGKIPDFEVKPGTEGGWEVVEKGLALEVP